VSRGSGATLLRFVPLLLLSAAAAQEPAEAALRRPAGLAAKLDALIAPIDAEQGIRVGVCVRDLEGGTVYAHRAGEDFVLASNMKLATTAAALLALPPGFRWETRSWLADGRLWIRGGGDPSLRVLPEGDAAEAWLDDLSFALDHAGAGPLREIVVDQDHFDREWRHPLWPEEQWQAEYEAPVSALGVYGNCVRVAVADSRAAQLEPALEPPLELRVAAGSGPRDFRAWWSRADQKVQVSLGGEARGEARIAVKDPGDFVTRFVAAGLARRGWRAPVRLAEPEEPRPAGKPLHVQPSAWSLAQAVVVANKESDNWVTEMIFKTLAARSGGPGGFGGGAAAVRAALAGAGAEEAAFAPADGSGMARSRDDAANAGTPAAVCELLEIMSKASSGRIYFDSLLVGGAEGRIEQLFADPLFADGRVRAKTGWITGASSLSGYVLAGDDQVLAFSVLVNYTKDDTMRTHNRRFRELQKSVVAEVLRAWEAPR